MLRNIISFFKFFKQTREELNNSICEKLDEFNCELRKSRQLESIEFYEKVKNDKSLAYSLKKIELSEGKISREEYNKFVNRVNSIINAIESGIIGKKDFIKMCFIENK